MATNKHTPDVIKRLELAGEQSSAIEISRVSRTYQMGTTIVRALNGISLTIERGDFVAIMGPSGSGKSTLMHLLGLLDVPEKGSYRLFGKEVSALDEDTLAHWRAQTIGFVFQQFNLLPRTSAVDNVALPLLYRTAGTGTSPDRLLDEVGLSGRAHHFPNELSGGQQQRVAIARSLVNSPKIVLADEPTGNLDSASEQEILGMLGRLNQSGITVIVVTHEEEVARRAKRIIRMRDGNIQSDERLTPLHNTELDGGNAEKFENGNAESRKNSFLIRHLMRNQLAHASQGLKSLAANKVRSGLSMLGILIGVAALVAILAIGQGAKDNIEKNLSSLGTNLLVVMPGSMRTMGIALEAGSVTRFTQEDAKDIEQLIRGVKQTSATVSGRIQVTYGSRNWNTQVTGSSFRYSAIHNWPVQVGRFFNSEEDQKRSRIAVIGTTVARELFGKTNPIGEYIRLNGVIFQVIGVLKGKGAQGFRDEDDVALIPLNTAMHRLLGKDYLDQIEVEVTDPAEMGRIQAEIMTLLIRRHRLPPSLQDDSFQIRNMAEFQQALTSTSRVLSGLLTCIAAISLLVGGIGIMNIMLVSVTERTREIGLRKALGAKRADILLQFLVEAVIISAIGGALGVILAWVVSKGVTALAGWTATVSPAHAIMALCFSGFVGVVFGLWPAKKAAELSPIDALRYE